MQISQGKTRRKGPNGRAAWLLAATVVVMPATLEAVDVSVDCDAGGSINAALAPLDRQGPHTITVTGTCRERVSIFERERVTIQAPAGQTATVDAALAGVALFVNGSRNINLRRLVLTGGTNGLVVVRSEVVTAGLTSENNAATGVVVTATSRLVLASALVRNNGGAGVVASNTSLIAISGATAIEDNGSVGLLVANDAFANVFGGNRIQNNGTLGVDVFHSSTINLFDSTIAGNRTAGVRIAEASHGELGGNTITGNGAMEPSEAFLSRGGVLISENSDVFIGGNNISNNTGPGVFVTANATLSSVGGNTIGGNSAEGVRLRRISIGQFFAADTISANAGANLACDDTSLAAGDLTGVGRVQCKQIERELGPPRPGRLHDLPTVPEP